MIRPPLAPPPDTLRREAEVFTRYLVAEGPSEYVASKYRDGHRAIPYVHGQGGVPVDIFLVRVARWGRLAVRLADSYARIFRRTGPLRQKLVLLAAILESSPQYHIRFQSSEATSRPLVYGRLAGIALGFAVRLAIGVLVFGPVHLVSMLTAGGARPMEAVESDG